MLKVFKDIDELLTLKKASLKKARGIQEKDLSLIKKGAMVSYNGEIVWIGKSSELKASHLKKYKKKEKVISLKGYSVLPAFVEPHTHLIFAGERQNEFEKRNQGESYQSIASQGGGILATVKATRKASLKELKELSQKRVEVFLNQGVTSLEVKSGYALDLKNEIKILKVARQLKGPRIVSTYLGLHALPPEFLSTNEYVDFVIAKVLPKVRPLTGRVDAFVEKNYFSPKQALKMIKEAKKLGFQFTLHTEQMSLSGGYKVAIKEGALSADHLVCVRGKDILNLAKSDITSVLLPTADFYLKCPYPPARKILDQGGRVALATDFNPGSSRLKVSLLLVSYLV